MKLASTGCTIFGVLVFYPRLECIVSSFFYSNVPYQIFSWTNSTFNLVVHLLLQLSFTFLCALSMCSNIWKVRCCQLQSYDIPFVYVAAYGRTNVVLEVHSKLHSNVQSSESSSLSF